MTRRRSFVVYSDLNMNIIDGSSVWTQSMCLALAGVPGVSVSLLLRNQIENDRLLTPLIAHSNISLINPNDLAASTGGQKVLNSDLVSSLLADEIIAWDVVVVRGRAAAHRIAQEPAVAGRLWSYLTDVPQHVLDVSEETTRQIEEIGSASQVVLCQTEDLRSFLEVNCPSVNGKTWLLPP